MSERCSRVRQCQEVLEKQVRTPLQRAIYDLAEQLKVDHAMLRSAGILA